jgi:hypothetical protein
MLIPNAYADLLDCNSERVQDKLVFNLGLINGSPLRIIACTDRGDFAFGRAYIEWRNSRGEQRVQDIPGYGGCGRDALHARRVDDEILVSQETCQSREYHPSPYWEVSTFHWDKKSDGFLQTKLVPKK